MTETLKQKIEEELVKLPKEKQNAIRAFDWAKAVEEIGKKYLLTDADINDLQLETGLVLIGLANMNSYALNIEDNVGVSSKEANEIAMEAMEKIFAPIVENGEKSGMIEKKETVLDKRFMNLPKELQSAITESDFQAKLYAIAKKHKLSINQMGALEDVIVSIMVGDIHPDKSESKLAGALGLPKEEIVNLINDVNNDLLKNIREILKRSWNNNPDAKDDSIPLPPYANKDKTPLPLNKNTSSGILATAGIEMLNEKREQDKDKSEEKITKKEDGILEKSGISMIESKPEKPREHLLPNTATQNAVLEGIEHPADISTSIIGDKLGGTTISKNSTSNYSIPKINGQPITPTQAPAPNPHDPYHEAI